MVKGVGVFFRRGGRRVFSVSGEQVKATRFLKRVVKREFSQGLSKNLLREMIVYLKNFEEREISLEHLEKLYSKRTAEDIIHSKKIVKFDGAKYGVYPVQGCMDYSIALIGLLNAKGVKAELLRYKNHSTVLVYEKDKIRYWVDVFKEKIRDLKEPNQKLLKKILKSKNSKKGKDAWSIEVKSIKDFYGV